MAGKKENLKALFTNVRSRVIIIFTFVVLAIAVTVGIYKFTSHNGNNKISSGVNNAPNISSIPGALNPTAQYVKLQENQNLNQAKSALKSGNSAIPTIVRSQSIGSGSAPIGVDNGQGGVGFSTLINQDDAGLQRSEWLQKLANAGCTKNAINDVINQGATLKLVRSSCSCIQLKDVGYQLNDLISICSCPDLKRAGYNAAQLRAKGYDAAKLRQCGYSACELRNAGFTAQQMLDGGFTPEELKGAGYNQEAIDRASGIPQNMSIAEIKKAGCSIEALQKLREQGVSASAVRRINGCSANQLKQAGFTASDLKTAGFTAADLKNAGFTPAELQQAGYSARDLLNAGFTPKQLADAGYSAQQISAAQAELPPSITAADIKKAGCGVAALENERLAGVSAKLIRQDAGCSLNALKQAGFTNDDLTDAGFSPAQINAAAPLDDAAIRAAGCDPAKLKYLLSQGISASKISSLNQCTNAQLAAAGFTPDSGADTPKASSIIEGRRTACSVSSLTAARLAGVSASAIRDSIGCGAAALKAAGYSLADLKKAGFTAAELKDAGFNAAQLKAAGFNAKELAQAGFTPQELKAAGFTAAQLKDAGFNAQQLKDAGYNAQQLKDAGFSAADLKQAGFSNEAIKAAGYSKDALTDAGIVTNLPSLDTLSASAVSNSTVPTIPGYTTTATNAQSVEAANAARLQEILKRQTSQVADQKYQQKIQQRNSVMLSSANLYLQEWKRVNSQTYIQGSEPKETNTEVTTTTLPSGKTITRVNSNRPEVAPPRALIKTGDILFAVIDTSVNSDEPGPILATIVSGKYKGAKLIGSFNLPSNAEKIVISFNTMSVPGATRSTSVSAYAIDANTARTALSSNTDTHFWYRYGNLFASSFLEGLGGAFQSADTSVTVGGTGAGDSITVENGVGRSLLQNTVIALGDVGKQFGQVAQQNFNLPTTVEVYSGTAIGVLFTQDLTSL